MAEFGDFKIKQAKIFKDYDSGLLKLKQREHQLIEESRKVKNSGSGSTQHNKGKQQPEKPEGPAEPKELAKIEEREFDKYASFYLDQFFLYLNASVTVSVLNTKGPNGTDNANQSSGGADPKLSVSATCSQIQNEEKVKEMWS